MNSWGWNVLSVEMGVQCGPPGLIRGPCGPAEPDSGVLETHAGEPPLQHPSAALSLLKITAVTLQLPLLSPS
ncbi:UNVERIFIED_CONTAM: hypothetical protein FKN15_059561 [Acipenser sinensis]